MPNESINTKKSIKIKKPSKQAIYSICSTIIIASVAIIAVVLILRTLSKPVIEEAYFVSDDTKSVISLDSNRGESEDGSAVQTHLVYTYDGDNVTGLKTYFEYPSEEAAATAIESLKDQPEFQGAVLEGKYIVVTADASQFEGLTASDVRQQAEAIQRFQESQKPKQESNEQSTEETHEGGQEGPEEDIEDSSNNG